MLSFRIFSFVGLLLVGCSDDPSAADPIDVVADGGDVGADAADVRPGDAETDDVRDTDPGDGSDVPLDTLDAGPDADGDGPDAEPDADPDSDEPDADPGCPGDQACGDGEVCEDDGAGPACREGCRGDRDCDLGTLCDRQLWLCTPGCGSDDDCAADLYCDSQQLICVEGCRRDDQCEAPLICTDVVIDDVQRRACGLPDCAMDQDCPDSFYCGVDPETREFACLAGCRTTPDDCGPGLLCNARTRACEVGSCIEDVHCAPGRVCEGEGCTPGCRQDDQCALDCVDGFCGCTDEGDCAEGLVCGDDGRCVGPCAGDPDCPDGLVCSPQSQSCVEGCTLDAECGGLDNGFRCDPFLRECGPIRCEGDRGCPARFFCDRGADPAVCEEGCRVGDCGFDQYCDVETRVCTDGCAVDDDCQFGLYCDADHACRVGCRDDAECGFGDTCQDTLDEQDEPTRRCLPPACDSDDDCDESAWCGFDEFFGGDICLPGCRTAPDNCPEGSFCNGEARFCEIELCERDGDCDQGLICFDFGFEMSCRIGCRDDDECGQGQTCLGGIFRCSCQSNDDCGPGRTCSIGECGAPCTPDSCGVGLFCNPNTLGCQFSCESDADCGGFETGLRCEDEECVPRLCTRDQQCGPSQYCDGTCQRGCRIFGCGDDAHCDEAHDCQPGCRNDDDCPYSTFCDARTDSCIPGCQSDDECPGDFECREVIEMNETQRFCAPRQCRTDADCPLSTRCLDDANDGLICTPACRTNPDTCGAHAVCIDRNCQARDCARDSDCRNAERCLEGVFGLYCGFGCTQNSDCAQGQTCSNAQCTCDSPADCDGLQGCEGGLCIQGCTQNADCPAGQDCNLVTQVCDGGLDLCAEDEQEPNNFPWEAIRLAPAVHNDLRICATFAPPEVSGDCWEVAMEADQRLQATISFDHDTLDLDVFLFTLSVVEVAAGVSRTDNETLDFTAPVPGPYILCVLPTEAGNTTYSLRFTVR